MSSKTTPTDGYGPDGIDGARVGRQMGLFSMVLGMGGLITSAFLIGIPIGAVAVVLGLTAIIKSIGAHRRIEKAGRQPRTIYVTAQNAHERCEHHEYNTPAYNECITNELGN